MTHLSSAESFILPDLVADCHFPLHNNVHCDEIARISEKWLLDGANHNERRRRKFMGLKAGELTASCYPDADAFHLRVCVDFMNYLFNLDDWLDEFDVHDTQGMRNACIGTMRHTINSDKMVAKMTESFFSRFEETAGPGCKERFIHTMDLFFIAVAQQSMDRAHGNIPDLESYITIRRDTSGCKPCFALIEFAARIDLPDYMIEHPCIQAMEEATNDLVTWSNDLFSYNVEQSRGDTHNMIPVLMNERGFTLQEAVDFVGEFCSGSIRRFQDERNSLPSWGPELDRDVQLYINGLQDWIVGSLHWSFMTERYFGKDGPTIKRHRNVELLPRSSPSRYVPT